MELDLGRLFGVRRSLALLGSADNLLDERHAASGYMYDQPYFIPGATRSFYLGLSYGF